MAIEKRLIKVCDATAVYNGIALYMAENAYLNDTALDVLKMVAKWLDEAPTVEAEPVVHGRWEYGQWEQGHWVKGNERCRCSVCHRDFAVDNANIWNGCPHCLAKMDGGDEGV